jgi:hypothetical protein
MGDFISKFFGSDTEVVVPVEEEEIPKEVTTPNWNSSFWTNTGGFNASGSTSIAGMAKEFGEEKDALQDSYEDAAKEDAKKAAEEELARQEALLEAQQERNRIAAEEQATANQQQKEWEEKHPAPLGRDVPCFIAVWPDGNMAQCQVIEEGNNLAMCGMLPKESFIVSKFQGPDYLRIILGLICLIAGLGGIIALVYKKVIKPKKNQKKSNSFEKY